MGPDASQVKEFTVGFVPLPPFPDQPRPVFIVELTLDMLANKGLLSSLGKRVSGGYYELLAHKEQASDSIMAFIQDIAWMNVMHQVYILTPSKTSHRLRGRNVFEKVLNKSMGGENYVLDVTLYRDAETGDAKGLHVSGIRGDRRYGSRSSTLSRADAQRRKNTRLRCVPARSVTTPKPFARRTGPLV